MKPNTLFFLFIFLSNIVFSQEKDSIFNNFKNFGTTSMGSTFATFATFGGTANDFIKSEGGGNLAFLKNISKNKMLWGITMDFITGKVKKNFTIPSDYEHYKAVGFLSFGLTIGVNHGNTTKSYSRTSLGFNYSSFFYKKKDKKLGPLDGFCPSIEFSRLFRFGKPYLRSHEYYNYQPRYAPSLNQKYIDFFVGYRNLIFGDKELKGHQFLVGLRYSVNTYYLSDKK